MASKDEIETAPDPEEDDLDDLDDVLDEFEAKPSLPTEPIPAAATSTASKTAEPSGPGRPSETATATAEDGTAIADEDEDLSTHLQAGMNSLISELGSNPEMQQQFEEMMAELLAAGAAPTTDQAAEHVKRASENMPVLPSEEVTKGAAGSKAGAGTATGSKKEREKEKEESFQTTIQKTMERMQASSSAATQATSTSAAAKSEDELFAEMLQSLGAGDAAGGSEEDFNTMLLSMMSQLTNKEILYEPMKELHEKFPGWMESHADAAPAEDLVRYREQQRLVGEIVGRFERSGYSDADEGDREFIVERMQKMQAQGSPPPDLVGDMSAAQEALGDLDAGCPTQ